MKRFAAPILLSAVPLLMLGCPGSPPRDTQATSKVVETHDAVPAAADAHLAKMEVACAHCVYHLDGVDACAPATMVDGKPMLLTGVDLEDPSLCVGPKEAMVAGEVKDGEFVANKIELE